MPFGEIGAILLFLLVVFIFGNLWFHFIEAILRRIKKLFTRRQKPPAWHTLPPDEEDKNDGYKRNQETGPASQ